MPKPCANGCFSGEVSASIGCPECNPKGYRTPSEIKAIPAMVEAMTNIYNELRWWSKESAKVGRGKLIVDRLFLVGAQAELRRALRKAGH